jgi:SP family general alpha glucoside:H+ symporter-like MFS transporter
MADMDEKTAAMEQHEVFDQARAAADEEHAMTLLQAMRKYPKAVLWSVLLSTCIVMEGYDIVLMSSFFAQPSFSRKYGEFNEGTGSYEITASWQNGLSNAVSVGTIIGAFANGYFIQRYGYRPVLLVSLAAICAFIFISFFAPNAPVLLVGQFLCGIPWGVFATMAPAYASEVCPLALRGYLTVYVNLCWARNFYVRTVYETCTDFVHLHLGFWPTHLGWSTVSILRQYHTVGVPNTVCHSMGMAFASLCDPLDGTRISMAPRTHW